MVRGPVECWALARFTAARRSNQRSTESVVGVAGAWAAVAICVTSVTEVARAGGDFAGRVVDVVVVRGSEKLTLKVTPQ